MKFFTEGRLRRVALLVVLNLLIPLVALALVSVPAMAASEDTGLTEKDALTGLAIAIGIILIAKLAKSIFSEQKSEENVGDKNPPIGYTDSDLELLARVIYAESRGEPYEGQVAVGAVILNRVKSSQFPNTIRGVIYAPGQFTSVTNGQVNIKPNETAYRAARDALAGKDPSNGALYFYNPKTARNMSFFSKLRTTVVIGNHVFAK